MQTDGGHGSLNTCHQSSPLRIARMPGVRVSSRVDACLVHGDAKQAATYFCRFADLLPNDFPLVGIVLLDGGKQRGALLTHQHTRTTMSAGAQLTSSSANSA